MTWAHWGLIPVGTPGGYHEAADSVRDMYEEGPDQRMIDDPEQSPWDNDHIHSLYREHSQGLDIGSFTTFHALWPSSSRIRDLDPILQLIADRHYFDAYVGADAETCLTDETSYRYRLEIDIEWPEKTLLWLPAFPLPLFVPVEEGCLHYAATHSDEIHYYTRVYEKTASLLTRLSGQCPLAFHFGTGSSPGSVSLIGERSPASFSLHCSA